MAGLTRQVCLVLATQNRPCLLRHVQKASRAFQFSCSRSFNTKVVRLADKKLERPAGIGDSSAAAKKSNMGKGKYSYRFVVKYIFGFHVSFTQLNLILSTSVCLDIFCHFSGENQLSLAEVLS